MIMAIEFNLVFLLNLYSLTPTPLNFFFLSPKYNPIINPIGIIAVRYTKIKPINGISC